MASRLIGSVVFFVPSCLFDLGSGLATVFASLIASAGEGLLFWSEFSKRFGRELEVFFRTGIKSASR